MEAGTTPTTGSTTIADLLPRAAEQYARSRRRRYKADGEWRDVTFAEVGEIVSEIGARADRPRASRRASASASSPTRAPSGPTPTSRSRTAGGVVVPIYPTNSPEECEWVAGNSEAVGDRLRGRRAGRQDRRRSATACRTCATSSSSTGRRHRRRDHARRPARARPRPRPRRARASAASRSRPTTPSRSSTRRARPARRRAACSRTATTAAILDMCRERGLLEGGDDLVYLFLPLAHAFALLIQLLSFDLGDADRLLRRRHRSRSSPSSARSSRPTCRRSRGSSRSSTRWSPGQRRARGDQQAIRTVGGKVQDLEVRGEQVPAELREHFDAVRREAPSSCAACSAAACARRSPARRRSRRRSSSSSGPAACPCSRATA